MSRLRSMTVQNIRTHDVYSIDFSQSTTVITGKNGAGKTSLIEALHIALQGKTFKTSDIDVLRKHTSFFKVVVVFDDSTERSVIFSPNLPYKKQFVLNGKKVKRLAFTQKIPLVLFEPEDLRLITGSPSRRRNTIDTMLGRINSQYTTYLHRYEKALQQRNTLLKQQSSKDDLFPWNVTLSKYGCYIILQRHRYIQTVNMELTKAYQTISCTDDTVEMYYQSNQITSEQALLDSLEKSYTKDKFYGYTSIGPHRDTIEFSFNNLPAEAVTSRGEGRSIIVALKQIELLLIQRLTGYMPLLLLDDVLSELDTARQKQLILQNKYQTVITSTKAPHIKDALVIRL